MLQKPKTKFIPKKPIRKNRINEEIDSLQVRLITEEGQELVNTADALRMAKEQAVDLVEITRQDIPIVKIIDYGKFKFEKDKKEKINKKKQKVIHLKEIKMGPKIDVGDFERKCQSAREFLNGGDNVKVSMRFKGREIAHTSLGMDKMNEYAHNIEDAGVLEKRPILEGKVISMIFRPKGKKN